MDRSAINRALAKAMAYRAVGKEAQADAWAAELVRLLGSAGILKPGALSDALTPVGWRPRSPDQMARDEGFTFHD